jgi:SAM-dependent methyltransferase
MKVVRYAQVLRRLRELPTDATILEVGSGASGLGTWSNRAFVGVDLTFETFPVPHMRPVTADAAHLPFPDDRFDLVVCVDVLQELPRATLEPACVELARVARGAAVIVAACGPEAEAADRRTMRWCEGRGIVPPAWLPGQIRRGLPPPEAIRSILAPYGRLREGSNRSVAWQQWAVRTELRPALRYLRAAAAPFLRVWGRLAPRPAAGGGEPAYARWFILDVERGNAASSAAP